VPRVKETGGGKELKGPTDRRTEGFVSFVRKETKHQGKVPSGIKGEGKARKRGEKDSSG